MIAHVKWLELGHLDGAACWGHFQAGSCLVRVANFWRLWLRRPVSLFVLFFILSCGFLFLLFTVGNSSAAPAQEDEDVGLDGQRRVKTFRPLQGAAQGHEVVRDESHPEADQGEADKEVRPLIRVEGDGGGENEQEQDEDEDVAPERREVLLEAAGVQAEGDAAAQHHQ